MRILCAIPLGQYDISPDGTWFVGLQRDPRARPVEVEVVLDWFEELKQRVPVK